MRRGVAFSAALIVSLAAWTTGGDTHSKQPIAPNAPKANPVDTSIFKSLKWRNVGPDRGGRSIAISGV
ncbi:MAG TPA: hypothetical protein VN513_03490, partial [Gemmatimonadales bacterium]|nr:hypothetical protein [Gemmatimonadales bacterium]